MDGGVNIEADIPEAYGELFNENWRNIVFYGGRGKGTSWSVARALLIRGAAKSLRVLCTRELQTSIKDSVHRLLDDQTKLLGMRGSVYRVTDKEITSCINDTVFIFKGLRYNIDDTLRSAEGIDIVWVAEAHKVADYSWKVLTPTIRKETSQIIIDFNTHFETDPVFARYVKNKPPRTFVRKVTWRDNPWFPNVLREEMEYDRRVDPESAAHVWDGEFAKSSVGAIFKGKWRIDSFAPQPDWSGPYQGADWGFSVDPSVLMRVWVYKRKLYVEYEAWGLNVELDDLPKLFDKVPLSRNYKISADSSRPDTISHVGKHGFNIEGAEKHKDSVQEGIAFLRSFEEIIIHERCTHMVTEAREYSYKIDKLTGEPTTEIEDRHNHCWDAIRYALWRMILKSLANGRPSIRSLG